jgi:hypothetical protein
MSSLFLLLLVGNNQGLCGSSQELSEPVYDSVSSACFLSSPTHRFWQLVSLSAHVSQSVSLLL